MFINLESLRLLELNKNRLVEIPGLTFDGLNKVKVLKLKRNNLRYVTICMTFQRSVKWIHFLTWELSGIIFLPPGSWWTALSMVLIPLKSFILIGTRWDIFILKVPFSILVTVKGSSNISIGGNGEQRMVVRVDKAQAAQPCSQPGMSTSTKVFSFL